MKEALIYVDSSEKTPLPFPPQIVIGFDGGPRPEVWSVKTETKRLVTGDYALEGSSVLIERKFHMMEVARNVGLARTPFGRWDRTDQSRFYDCVTRLGKAAPHPILLLEETLSTAHRDTKSDLSQRADARQVLDALRLLCLANGVALEYTSKGTSPAGRLLTGEWVARTLILGLPEVGKKWLASLSNSERPTVRRRSQPRRQAAM